MNHPFAAQVEHRAKLADDAAKLRAEDPGLADLVRVQRHLSDRGHYNVQVRLQDTREMERRAHATNARAQTARLAAKRATAALAAKRDADRKAKLEALRKLSQHSITDVLSMAHHANTRDDDVAAKARDQNKPDTEIVQPQPKLPWSQWELDPLETMTAAAIQNAAYKTPYDWALDEDDLRKLDLRTVGLVRTNSRPNSRPNTAPDSLAQFEDLGQLETVHIHNYDRPVSPTTTEARAYLAEAY